MKISIILCQQVIKLYSRFLSDPDDGGRGQKEQILRLIDRMLELGGEDVIAWGMDLDGEITCDPSIGTPYGAVVYGEYLMAHGINTEIIDKLFFNNAYHFFLYRSLMQMYNKDGVSDFLIQTETPSFCINLIDGLPEKLYN